MHEETGDEGRESAGEGDKQSEVKHRRKKKHERCTERWIRHAEDKRSNRKIETEIIVLLCFAFFSPRL